MDKTKAKPKPKAGDKKAPAKPKGPGSKQLAMMKDHLNKLKEEEERQKREEEEQLQREEAARQAEEERLRLEKEKRERKKQREKEKIAQQKKEGTYLTAKQKAERQMALKKIQLLQQQNKVLLQTQRSSDDKDPDSEPKSGAGQKENGKPDSDENNEVSKSSESPVASEDSTEDGVDDWEELVATEKSRKEDQVRTDVRPKEVKEKKETQIESESFAKPEAGSLRSPIICVLGHVDTGKTKLLDYLRKSHVQDNEAGGITQQIGATYVPPVAINDQTRHTKKAEPLRLPGLLIIDTPGHESFSNLRSRGSSLCDIAILVIDIMHGLEPQTIESINLLKSRKTPFIVALNKVDRLYDWKDGPRRDIEDVIKGQKTNTKLEFEKRTKEVILQLNQQALNAALFYENENVREYISLVPTSAHTGDGMGNLINLLVNYSQNMLAKRIVYDIERLEATVLEVKAIPGHGTTIDVILVNGYLKEGDRIILAGHDGPIVTHIRSLLVPQPLKELRIKTPYKELKCVYGSIGVKVTGHELEKAVAGLELVVARKESDIEQLKADCSNRFGQAMRAIKCTDKGVYVQASTLGSLEALIEYLKESKVPYAGVRIGPVVKRDVMKASTMLESSPDHAIILAFDVKVEKDAQELADHVGLKIFTAEIIYHLFDQFNAHQKKLKEEKKEKFKHLAVFPCKLRILPQFIFNARDPIVVGVSVEDGVLVCGTPIAVPSKGMSHHVVQCSYN
jgi:translation initiation factor 5B